MMHKSANAETKEVIFKVFIWCLAEFQAGKLLSELENVYQRTADLTGISVSTVRQIASEGEKNDGVFTPPTPKQIEEHPKKKLGPENGLMVDSSKLCAIRQKVLYFYTVKQQNPAPRYLLPVVRDELGYAGSQEDLRKLLLALGFYFKKCKRDRSILIEKTHISAQREKYLKEILAIRCLPEESQKDIIYVDEIYAHSSYKLAKCWQPPGIGGVNHKLVKDNRYTIMFAGSEKGFVPNAMMIFSGTKKKRDYHFEMDHHNFTKWIQEKLIPNLSKPCTIVMDSAPYHLEATNKAPTASTKIEDINLWLLENNIDFDPTSTKPELLMLVKKHKPDPIYEIDEILGGHGHTVVRVPPYHCDLNPIGLIIAKARHKMLLLDEESTDIRKVAKQAINEITTEDWNNSCEQIANIENDYYEKGRTLYDEIDRLVPKFENDGNSSSSEEE